MKNKCEIRGEITAIFLKTKSGKVIETIIDTEDLVKLKQIEFSFCPHYEKKNNSYYVSASIKSNVNKSGWSTIQLHRLIMDTPKHLTVDHINHNTLDNRKCNLRNITHSENCQNKGAQRNSKSGIRGVHKFKNSWIAQFGHKGQKIYVGSFENIEDAEKAVVEARKKYMPYSMG